MGILSIVAKTVQLLKLNVKPCENLNGVLTPSFEGSFFNYAQEYIRIICALWSVFRL